MIPPALIREFALVGSGHLPFGRDEVYQLTTTKHQDDGLQYLAGTSEPALLAYYANQTIDQKKFPIKLCGLSSCYRSEIGSYGKDTKGLYRVHEFMKVEQVVMTPPDHAISDAMFDEMLGHAESLLKDLRLPYRLIETSTGDMGAGKYRMVDIETWMPGRNAYGETHSNSHLTDWQARRLGIRMKTDKGSAFVHTLNNTMIASPRILIAILENNQRSDGSVEVPKILQSFVGKKVLKPRQ
jgi:seryl-tRNA synthetase